MFSSIVSCRVSMISSLIFSLFSSNICKNVSLLDSLLLEMILVTLACYDLLFCSIRMEMLSTLVMEAMIGISTTFPITSRVRSFRFFCFLLLFVMFGKSFVEFMSYGTVKFCFKNDVGGRLC